MRMVNGQPGQPEDRKRVIWQSPAQYGRKALRFHLTWSNGCKSDDPPPFDGNIGRPDMVTKLILPGVLKEESVQIRVTGTKLTPVVIRPERPNVHDVWPSAYEGRESALTAFRFPGQLFQTMPWSKRSWKE